MDKLGKSFRKNLIENYYRLLALTHVTVNKFAIPTADKVSSYIQESVKLPEAEQNSTGLSTKLKRSLSDTILYGDELARKPLNDLAEYLDQSVMEVENKLKEDYNINTNQWMFSVGNLEMFEKIASLATITFKEVQHLGKINSIRYLSAWNMLQRLYLTSYEKRMESKKNQLDYPHDHEKVKELQAIRDECLHYSIFAHGTYGWLINHIYNGKQEFNQLLKSNRSHLDDFLFHTKLQEAAVFYSFWDTTPYKPAHIIAKDEKKKSIVLSIRGTDHWADAVTDLDFHYLSFSIVKDPNNGKLFLRFNYNEETQGYLKKRLGDDTRELNGEIIQPLTGREEVIETGFAHAGMLVSAIGAYKEITPKLEEILSRPEHSEYNLVVTGHSLGGGITTLMSLLYLIHPLPVFKDQAKEKLKGFSYGSASVLSTDFDKYLRDTLTTVVLGYDVVPRLSYGSVKDLCKVMLAFDEINSKDPSAFAEVMNMDTSGGDFDQLQKESKGRVGKFKSLYENFKHAHMDSLKLLPMGRVFHFQDMTMQPIKRNGRIYDYVMREITEKEYFDEIIFSRQLVKHHFPPLYEDALYSPRVLYQRYLEKAVNKEGSSITHSSEVKSYTK